ncbi:aspartate kinase [Tumidithrix elongata RA019]|uniref:aspartate kinase n=1 Tax=Tumidithrix elongata BACA0141 TaxID=2716417 RepID=A0AAW9Q6W4_9CYAN|nr:aspartate kinase [Tumidithrix elongata RA019]
MSLIVQKYGGSSVADPERIKAVRDRIKQTVDAGNQVVVVVSAMGKSTDNLIKLANAVTTPSKLENNSADPSDRSEHISADRDALDREMDVLLATGEQVTIALLSMALQSIGQPAIALTGAQVRVVTEPCHTRARILYVETDGVQEYLSQGKVVIIAGFQGVAGDLTTGQPTREITTLGRGGSDTSAVAIAAALNADLCEIYTDVPGILTTDPRIVPNAKLLDEITCDEMLELASLGAKVLHPRAVEIARNFGVKLAVRSSWVDDPGTLVKSPYLGHLSEHQNRMALEVNRFVDGVSVDLDQVKIALLQVPDRPGIAAQLFHSLALQNINVDLIIQAVQDPSDVNDIAFTVPQREFELAELVTRGLELGAKAVIVDSHVAKVSIIGAGMIGRPGVAAQMFTALANAGINIQMISTSEIKVSCVVAAADGDAAVAAIAEAFQVPVMSYLPIDDGDRTADQSPVRGVALDQNRARLAIRQVPDRPGVAAQIFEYLAQQNVSVDMIVQSQSDRDVNEIAFTVPIGDLQKAEASLKQVAETIGGGDVVSDDAIAKVSIVGTGMIKQGGVAARMFNALASSGINIEMIATSEIKVSCVVRQSNAETALRAIHQEFDLAGDQTILVAGKPAS